MQSNYRLPMTLKIQLKTVDLSQYASPTRSRKDSIGTPEANETFKVLLEETTFKCGAIQISSKQSPSKNRLIPALSFTRIFDGNNEDNEDQSNNVIKSILRYLKINDKYIAFTSLLLKSYIYHHQRLDCADCDAEHIASMPLHIAVLPKTSARKPYIPFDGSENSLVPFNISHQHPFVGLAYIENSFPQSTVHERSTDQSVAIGLDIVMFDTYKETQHLYSCVDEFIDVFKGSFSKFEWSTIKTSSERQLQEFFIRWATKEAYTKALGMGMGIEFDSFETHFFHTDGKECTQLFDRIKSEKSTLRLNANVTYFGQVRRESWNFIFIPLHRNSPKEDAEVMNIAGCACICIGPRHSDDGPLELNVSSSTLEDIIDYHVTSKPLKSCNSNDS